MVTTIINPMSWFSLNLDKENKTFDIKVQDKNGDVFIISIEKFKHLEQFYNLDADDLNEASEYLK